jgi:hypothetical protein
MDMMKIMAMGKSMLSNLVIKRRAKAKRQRRRGLAHSLERRQR